jgi:ATP-binding cassette subfamily B protein
LPRSHGYRRIFSYFVRYRALLLAGGIALLAGRLLSVWAPRLLGRALNALEERGAAGVSEATTAGWWFVGVSLAAGVFTFGMRRWWIGASRMVERDLKRDVFAHVERVPVSTFDRMRTGDLLSRLTSDVEAVRFATGPGSMYVASTLVMFPAALTSMTQLSARLTLAALVPLLATMLLVWAMAPGIMRRTRAVQDRIGDLSARALESFAGARVVRAYATEAVEVDAFRRQNDLLVEETLGLARHRAWMTAGLYVLGGLGELAVVGYGGHLVTTGDVQPGDLLAFLAYVGLLTWPMISVGWVVSAFQRSAAAVQRIDEVLSIPEEPATLAERDPTAPESFRGALDVRDLTFRYPGAERDALRGVSFSVPAGSTLALVGPVGSGKSTLLRLLPRLYEPPVGRVFLDGIDVARIPLASLRAAFTAVPQDTYLFSDSLEGNLAYARPDAPSRDEVLRAAAVAGLEPDLEAFPRGIETVDGERGVTLSGGQKQRATLARALLREAPVLLLDDALSSVDTHTEERILERLEGELRRRTAVVVAHRLSTVRHADRIVVLEDGRVAEEGTHEELLRLGGWYARTYADQRLEEEIEGAS